jgi:hypothetical protein
LHQQYEQRNYPARYPTPSRSPEPRPHPYDTRSFEYRLHTINGIPNTSLGVVSPPLLPPFSPHVLINHRATPSPQMACYRARRTYLYGCLCPSGSMADADVVGRRRLRATAVTTGVMDR